MSWWKKFLTARKQRDSIKIMLLLLAAALGFGAGAVYRGVSLYRLVNAPIEYVLYGEQKRIHELAELEGLVAVSAQQEVSRTFVYQGQEYSVSYMILSEEYLDKVYSIQTKGVTEAFYMNRPALRQLQTVERELFVSCPAEGGDGSNNPASSQSLSATVKLLLAEGIREQEKPLTVTAAKNSRQTDFLDGAGSGSGQVRICFGRQDLSGSQRSQLEGLGFSVENQELLLEMEYQKSELLLRMKYEALLGVLLAVGADGAWKYGKK